MINQQILIREVSKLKRLVELARESNKDSKQVARLIRKFGLGSIEWQQAMVKRVTNKIKKRQNLSEIDNLFIDIQNVHNELVNDELRAMGVFGTSLN